MRGRALMIEFVEIYNFRGIDRLRVEFHGRDAVIVGVNGAGKTAVVEAIAKALQILTSGLLRHSQGNESLSVFSLNDISNEKSLSKIAIGFVENAFEGAVPDRKFDVEIQKVSGSVFVSYDRDKVEFFARHTLNRIGEQGDAPVSTSTYYPANRTVPRLDEGGARKALEPKQINALLDAYGQSATTYVEFLGWFRAQEDIENEERLVNRRFVNSEVSSVRRALSGVMPKYRNLRVQRSKSRMVLDDKGSRLTVSVGQLSEGERALLSLVGDIARRLAIANPGSRNPGRRKGLILIDEVEQHLHPGWQLTVLDKLHKAFPKCQIIATTHSPQVVGATKGSLIVVSKKRTRHDVAEFLAPYGKDINTVLRTLMGTNERVKEVIDKLHKIENLIDKRKIKEAVSDIEVLSATIGAEDFDITRLQTIVDLLGE